jgi:hypothetical protein
MLPALAAIRQSAANALFIHASVSLKQAQYAGPAGRALATSDETTSARDERCKCGDRRIDGDLSET